MASLLAVALLIAASAWAQADKIPITTSVPEAREAYLQGRDLADKLRAQDARAHFQAAVAADSTFALARYNLALTEPTFRGFFSGLEEAAALAEGASPGERLLILGFKAGVDGFAPRQRELYEQLVDLFPKDERAHTLLGNHFFGQQEWDRAIASYEAAIRLAPEFSQPYNQMGYAHRFLGDFASAGEAFQQYIALIPDDPNPHDSYAELLLKMGRFDDSIASYRQALKVDPHFVASHIGIATNLNYLGEHAAARQQLEILYQNARTDGERRAALQATAISHVDEGDVGQALAVLDRQYMLDDSNGDDAAMAADLTLVGNILLHLNAPNSAWPVYEKALQLVLSAELSDEIKNNSRRAFLYNAVRVAILREDEEGCRTMIERYTNQASDLDNAFLIRASHELKGIMALETGDFAEAVAELEQANLQDPYNLYRLYRAHRNRGDEKQALEWLQRTVDFNPLNNLNYALIRVRARQELAGR